MPRPMRAQIVDGIYHVTSRGNRGDAIVADDQDRKVWTGLLEEAVVTRGWILHTYSLLTNHFHVLVQTPRANISEGMQRLNSEHAQWFNWKYGYKGHLFQGRFKSKLIDTAQYFAEVVRYVALNPVRAGLVHRPEDWPWSGYPATVGVTPSPLFLTCDTIIRQFSDDDVEGRLVFRDFVYAKMDMPGSDPGMAPLAVAVNAGEPFG